MIERREFLTAGGLALGAGGLGYLAGQSGQSEELLKARYHGGLLGNEAPERVWYRQKIIGQSVMDTQLLFLLGLAPRGLVDVGDVLDTASRIAPGDELSWFDEWIATGERLAGYAEQARTAGHKISAGAHAYRAGAYFRAGLMRYSRHQDPRMVQITKRTLALHDQALTLKGYDSRAVKIPYESGVLHGRVHYSKSERPSGCTLVINQGLHAWPEDTMWAIDAALERGYQVLSFHGPGQGASLRLEGHAFRPDWENVVSQVLDFAEQDARLGQDKFILMGLSFGGYLAPRAAAHEPRLAALVANPGVVSWADSMLRHFKDIPGIMALHSRGPRLFDSAIDAASLVVPDARWYFDDVTWKHGVDSPHELIDELRKFDNADGVSKIRCKTLIMEGTGEDVSPGESRRLYESLRCPKHLMNFDASTASQVHCQGGNAELAGARLFDWLDEEVRG